MHKRLIVIVMSVATLVLAASVTGFLVPTATARELETFVGNILDDGRDYVGRTIIITDPHPHSVSYCGTSYDEYKCVIIGGGPAIVTDCGVDQRLLVRSGDHYNITAQEKCDGRLDLTITPQ